MVELVSSVHRRRRALMPTGAGEPQRSIIVPRRQLLTFRFTSRVRLMRLFAAFVVARERCRRDDNLTVSTVSVSSRPSRTLSAALGYSASSRRARSSSTRCAVFASVA